MTRYERTIYLMGYIQACKNSGLMKMPLVTKEDLTKFLNATKDCLETTILETPINKEDFMIVEQWLLVNGH